MVEFAVSMFHLINTRGLFVPPLNYTYQETDTGVVSLHAADK
jgi:hypothetical protein